MEFKKNKVFISLIIFSIILTSVFVITSYYSFFPSFSSFLPNQQSMNYEATVCISKNGELLQCTHNFLYDAGKNATRLALSIGGGSNFTNISLCNSTSGGVTCAVATAGNGETYTSYDGCGLGSANGALYTWTGAPGNWSIVNTFTSSCDGRKINATRLMNATGEPLAGANFTEVTLQNSDTITINWTVGVS